MNDPRTWAIRPKWHRFETPRSYAKRQCEITGVPLDLVERGLTTPAQPNIDRVWVDDESAAAVVEAAAGRPAGHFQRLKRIAHPDAAVTYPERFLC